MKIDTFACDECGAQKKDTNHWFMLKHEHELNCIPSNVVEIVAWEKSLENYDYRHACGQACATKMLNRWFATGQLIEEKK